MAKIYISSAKELLVGLVALCGELPLDGLADKQKFYSEKYFQNHISLVCREKLVRKTRSEGREYLRLSLPKGDAYVMQFSEDLYENFLLMAEADSLDPRIRYKGASRRKARREAIARAILLFFEAGFPINGFLFEKISRMPADKVSALNSYSIFNEKGRAIPFENMASLLGGFFFVSSHYLREGSTLHAKDESSRKIGLLKTIDQAFLVYSIQSCGYTWTRDTEKYNKFKFEGILNKDIAGLFLVNNMEIFDRTINPQKITKSLCQPLSVFYDGYLVLEGQEGRAILDILKIRAGEEKLLRSMIPEVIKSNTCDGLINGMPVFNFMCCNIAKIFKARERIRNGEDALIILCNSKKETVLKFLKACPDAEDRLLIIPDEMFFSFVEKVKEEEKIAGI